MSDTSYFETSERAERLQLLVHLVHNAQDIPYLRAPAGAGKTRFAHEIAAQLDNDYELVWLSGDAEQPFQEQLHKAVPPREDSEAEEDVSLFLQEEPDGVQLLLVDDAELLQPTELQELFELHGNGTRMVLFGNGGLAHTENPPGLQFVDLPPFTEVQSMAFIQAQGKLGPGAVDERMAVSLHRASGGLPGPLLDALAAIPVAGEVATAAPSRLSWPLMLGGAILATLVVSALVFQEQVNRWFEPAPGQRAVLIDRAPGVAPAPAEKTIPGDEGQEEPVFKSAIAVEPSAEEPVSGQPAPASPGESATPPAAPAPELPEVGLKEEAASDVLAADLLHEPGAPTVQSVQEEVPAAAKEPPDPVLDAVIDAAISAAGQPPETAMEKGAEEPPGPAAKAVPAVPPQAKVVEPAPEPKPAPRQKPVREQKSATVAAPVVEMSVKAEAAQAKTESAAKVARKRSSAKGLDWLRAQPTTYYTLQLVGARDRAAIDKFIRRQGIRPPYAVFARELAGKPWYSLVGGSYPDRKAALEARAKLPKGLTGVWPRTFASVLQQLNP